ncbi:hypothetical protein MP638_001857 [Amoeboaphelidium occidentale]|nr:hypothetical protein MP638_001857 [Amoeboaphelidium occidentale]
MIRTLRNDVLSKYGNLTYCFAYGSGVLKQKNNQGGMIDLIFAVEDTSDFHERNLQRNHSDYSLIRLAGPHVLGRLNDISPGLYYNTDVDLNGQRIKYGVISKNLNGQRIKYGVISKSALIRDLRNWDTLYLAGRMHKPIIVLQDDNDVAEAQGVNLRNALKVSLSLLPQKFRERQLYETLTALSYKGDFRGYIGAESKTKINDIVDAQMHLFRDLYQPLLRELSESVQYEEFSGYIHQEKSPEATRKRLCTLPENLKLSPNESPERIQDQVNKIILRPSIVQALKGLLTAGLWTSFKYALRKVQKGLQKSK